MDRYAYVNKIKNDSGKRIYATSKYPVLTPSVDDTYIYSREGMRLDNLAFQYYGNAGLWWVIALANNIGKGTLVVPLKMQLRIPSTDVVNNINEELNNAQTDQ